MELRIREGDYVADNAGGLERLGGREALLQRTLFRLSARRGSFPFWETLGSRLWQLSKVPASQRQSAAKQYVTEALAEENVEVESVELTESGAGGAALTVRLNCLGQQMEMTLELRE